MVNPVGDSSNPLITPAKDSLKHRDSSQEKEGTSSSVSVSISEQAQGLSAFEEGSPLSEVLKNEFEEVFGLGDDKKDLLLSKLDHILADNGVEA